MNLNRSRVVSLAVAALSGVLAFFALVVAYAAISGLIEPHGRIEAFLLARPHHQHPLQLAAAGWLLHLAAGAMVGAAVCSLARLASRSPAHLLAAFAAGYLVAVMAAAHGMPPPGAVGHAVAVLAAAAATCTPYRRLFGGWSRL